MRKTLRSVLSAVVVALAITTAAFGQETTGNIEITVKDAAGAVIPNVPITVTSSGGTTGYKRTVNADDSGTAKLLLVPPGVYIVTAAATAGFVEKSIDQVTVGLGKTTPVLMEMGTTLGADVTVTADTTIGMDVTDTKMQTTISSQLAELIPKGINFSTVLKYSAATRPESRSGQFQIDGASGAENIFIVDGQEVTDVLSGFLNRPANLPFSIIQETQVKTSGFEAEYGGATGGVVNVVTKGGGNELHGEFGINLRSSRFEPIPANILFAFGGAGGTPAVIPSRRNQFNETNPTATLLGPIWKDKIWFSAAYAPQITRANRVLTYSLVGNRREHYFSRTRAEKAFGRIDAQPFSKLHLTGTIQWNPETQNGALPGYTAELATTIPSQAGNPSLDGARFLNQTGGRLNSINNTFGGSYIVTNNFIVTARMGHYFLNNKLGTYGFGDINIPRIDCAGPSLSRANFPAGFGCQRYPPCPPTGPNPCPPTNPIGSTEPTNNGVTAFGASLYDATTRDQFDADATYSFGAFGSHELKGGIQNNTTGNKVQQQNTDQITLRSGTTPPSRIGDFAGVAGLLPAPGAIGSGSLSIIQTQGNVTSKNFGFYVQDKWQPTRRLTLNLGVRTEREEVPSYAEGLKGLNFSFGSKIAPRLGVAYDLTGDGKTKISGFYGLFYDRFKLSLPRGSFGGDQFHVLYFDLLPGDNIFNLNRTTLMGPGQQPIVGGSCPTGTTTPIYGRIRCDKDERISSNNPLAGDLSEVGGNDPNLKPFQQREITFTFQRQLSNNYLASARYTRKQVVRAIEDVGFVNSQGSTAYLTSNPGEGLAKEFLESAGLVSVKAQRQYDALELRLDRRFANNYFFSVNYTLSRLYGNYSGLISSDEEGGRSDPNVQRYFDEPSAGFTVAGGPDNGRLATDRPHVLKAYGTYNLNWDRFGLWKNNETSFQMFYTISSGSVITSFVNIRGVEQIILNKRGDLGRTPVFSQTDFALRHTIKFGKDERFKLSGDVDVINLFNQFIVTNRGRNPSGQGGNIISTTNFDILDPANLLITQAQLNACAAAGSNRPCYSIAFKNFQENGAPKILERVNSGEGRNPFYNIDSQWQGKRTIRYGLRLVF